MSLIAHRSSMGIIPYKCSNIDIFTCPILQRNFIFIFPICTKIYFVQRELQSQRDLFFRDCIMPRDQIKQTKIYFWQQLTKKVVSAKYLLTNRDMSISAFSILILYIYIYIKINRKIVILFSNSGKLQLLTNTHISIYNLKFLKDLHIKTGFILLNAKLGIKLYLFPLTYSIMFLLLLYMV